MSKAERDLATLDAEDGELLAADESLSALIDRLRGRHEAQSGDGALAHELADTLVQRAGIRHWAMRLKEAAADLDEAETLIDRLKPLPRHTVRTLLLDARARLYGAPYSPWHDDAAAAQALQALRRELADDANAWITEACAMRLAEWRGDPAEMARCARALAPPMQAGGHWRGLRATELTEARALLSLGRPREAEPLAAGAWAFFEQPGPPDIAAGAALTLARARGNEASWPLAERALATVEQLTRAQRSMFDQQRYLAAQQDRFDQALALALRWVDPAAARPPAILRAWQVAERAKSFSLRQAMTQGGWLRSLDPAIAGPLQDLDRRLQSLEAQGSGSEAALERRAALAAERQSLMQQAMRQSPRVAAAMQLPPPLDLQAQLARLPAGCGVVSWYWLPERGDWRLLVFHAGGDRQPRLAQVAWTGDALGALEARARAFAGRHPGFIEQPLPAPLGDRLLPPAVLEALQGCHTLLVTPHRQLRQLPLHAMQLGPADAPTGLLIERFAMQMLPTLALPFPSAADPGSGAAPREVLLLGCEQDGFRSQPLYDVVDELRGIAEAWQPLGHPVQQHVLSPDEGFSARAPLADWPRFDVIHLACHGSFVPESPLDASLYLGNEALRASELFGVDLKAEVVCMSACDVGRHGEQIDGVALVSDEWLGLAMPLFQAGARHVLTSLWAAQSAVACAFMQGFHAALAAGKTPAQAHRQASLSQLHCRFGFWANWQLAGFPTGSRHPATHPEDHP
ncbi:MAG: CHAT domain-containing protein [Betaproteobacteria bacterium]|nr:CHAT domain-containing protein [Betaproteobacteria bacterium]